MVTKIFIKNMVCHRCKIMVRNIFESAGVQVAAVDLGEIDVKDEMDEAQKQKISAKLEAIGFEWVDDKKSRQITQIKAILVDLVHQQNAYLTENLSVYLGRKMLLDYTYISNLFSEVEGVTIEKYFVIQKIERVKELLVYNELTLGEIAELLQYSSIAYLSNQFKKVTGLTPSHFKKIKHQKRISLDDL